MRIACQDEERDCNTDVGMTNCLCHHEDRWQQMLYRLIMPRYFRATYIQFCAPFMNSESGEFSTRLDKSLQQQNNAHPHLLRFGEEGRDRLATSSLGRLPWSASITGFQAASIPVMTASAGGALQP